jgi:hypothetical protein
MWKNYSCAEVFPDLGEIDSKSIDVIERVTNNKKLYNILRATMFITSTILSGLDFTIDAGFMVHSLFGSNADTGRKHKQIFKVIKAMVNLTKVTSLNFIALDEKIRTINPDSNFIKRILSLKFNGDFNSFERECDDIFNKETYQYTSKDFVSLLCILFISKYITEKDYKSFVDQNIGILNLLSPYRSTNNKELSYDEYIKSQSFTIIANQNYIDLMRKNTQDTKDWKLYKNGKEISRATAIDEKLLKAKKYTISIPMSLSVIAKDKIPYELYDKLIETQRHYNSRELKESIRLGYKNTEISKAKDNIEDAWNDYVLHVTRNRKNIREKKKLRFKDDKAPSKTVDTFIKHLITSKAEIKNEELTVRSQHAEQLSIIDSSYEPLIGLLTRPEIAKLQKEKDGSTIRDMTAFNRLINEIYDMHQTISLEYSKEKELEVQRSIDVINFKISQNIDISPKIKEKLEENMKLKTFIISRRNELNKNIKEKEIIIKKLTTKHPGLARLVKNTKFITNIKTTEIPRGTNHRDIHKQFKEINALLKYYDSIKDYNTVVGGGRDITDELLINTHAKMNYDKSMKRVFSQYRKAKEVKLFKDSAITLALGSVWATYSFFKFSINVIPTRLKSIIFDSSKSTSLFDEVIGIVAGMVLGPKYLAKNAVTKKQLIKEYAKEIISPDKLTETDPLMNEVISDMITGKIGKTVESEEELDLSVMIDKDIKREIEQYKKIKMDVDPSISTKDKKKLIETMMSQNEKIKQEPDKFNKEVSKDNTLKGSYVGMISNSVSTPKISSKWKTKVHKLLCTLSLRSRNISKLLTAYLTQSLAISYVASKLTQIVMSEYIKNKALMGNTLQDLCDYASYPHEMIPVIKPKQYT